MKFSTFIGMIANGQFSLMFKLMRTTNEFYRACFVSTACSQGIYDHFADNKSTLDQLCEKLDMDHNREGLFAWLELGVSLGELKKAGNEYQIKGKLSRELIKPDNDAHKALLEEIIRYHHPYVINTPAMLKQHKYFPFDETPGELVARSSRISEPFIFEAVDAVIPRRGNFRLLEVGCGSGIYIQRACSLNSDLTAIGLELQEKVADAARENIRKWGLENRVSIEHRDIKNYFPDKEFDLITLHQNIYYFQENDREDLFRHLSKYLKPGGRVLLTTICQGGGPAMQAVNVWVSNTEGYGPLSHVDRLCQQFKSAGFKEMTTKRLIPFESFWSFAATKAV